MNCLSAAEVEDDVYSFLLKYWITDHEVENISNFRFTHTRMVNGTLTNAGMNSDDLSRIFYSGSRSEGLSCREFGKRTDKHFHEYPDDDIMVAIFGVDVLESVEDTHSLANSITDKSLTSLSTDHLPNYFKKISKSTDFFIYPLISYNNTISEHATRIKCVARTNRELPCFACMEGQFSGSVIASQDWRDVGTIGEHQLTKSDFTLETHGPALCRTSILSRGDIGLDLVVAIPCRFWPTTAFDWITRSRASGWPNFKLRFNIISEGCHLVAVGPPNSTKSEIEWRWSFSKPEVTLAAAISPEQRKAYLIAKTLLKFGITWGCDEEVVKLPSYWVKTVFFFCLERQPISAWKSNLFRSVKFLLQTLATYIRDQNLPHFFIPRHNMLSHLSCDELSRLAAKIENVHCNLLRTLIEVDNTYIIHGRTIPVLRLTVLFHPLIRFVQEILIKGKDTNPPTQVHLIDAKLKCLARLAVFWLYQYPSAIPAIIQGYSSVLLSKNSFRLFADQFLSLSNVRIPLMVSSLSIDQESLLLSLWKRNYNDAKYFRDFEGEEMEAVDVLRVMEIYFYWALLIFESELKNTSATAHMLLAIIYTGKLTKSDIDEVIDEWHKAVFRNTSNL